MNLDNKVSNVVKDIVLKQEINKILEREIDTDITKEDMSKITKLRIGCESIFDTSSLKYAVNIKFLELFRCNITNIDLSNNINLEYLSLYNNKITNIDLSNNINLREIYLVNNKILLFVTNKQLI